MITKKVIAVISIYDPDTTRHLTVPGSGVTAGMDDALREVISYEEGGVYKSARRDQATLKYVPCIIENTEEDGENLSAHGDDYSQDVKLLVDFKDLFLKGYATTITDKPFKKSDQILRIEDFYGNVLKSYNELYIDSVEHSQVEFCFHFLILYCKNRNETE